MGSANAAWEMSDSEHAYLRSLGEVVEVWRSADLDGNGEFFVSRESAEENARLHAAAGTAMRIDLIYLAGEQILAVDLDRSSAQVSLEPKPLYQTSVPL